MIASIIVCVLLFALLILGLFEIHNDPDEF